MKLPDFRRPFRTTDPVDNSKRRLILRRLMSVSIILFMIFLPIAIMCFLTIFKVIDPTVNQWFAVFVLFALGVFLDWLI